MTEINFVKISKMSDQCSWKDFEYSEDLPKKGLMCNDLKWSLNLVSKKNKGEINLQKFCGLCVLTNVICKANYDLRQRLLSKNKLISIFFNKF